MKKTVWKATALIFVLSFIAKIIGFIKSIFQASYFGASFQTDALNVADGFVSNILYMFTTAISVAFLPLYIKHKTGSREEGKRFASRTITALFLFAIAITVFLECGVDWKIGYSPERINPGDRVHTLTSIRKVVSGMDEESANEIKKVYDIVIKAGTVPVSNIKTAEAVKVVENSQRDINIAFMNEIAIICDKLGIDTNEVLYGMNSKWNALGFKPGLVGGHCIGVDPYYLTNCAEMLGYHSQIILNGRKVNDSMGGYVADAAIKQMIEAGQAPKKATVVVLGITFKENCPDTRNSKVVDIINRLKEYEITPVVTDSWADPVVAKQEYDVDLIPFDELPKADCVIVAVGHNEFRNMSVMQLKQLFKPELKDKEKVLVDVKSLYRMDELKASGMRFWRL